MNWSFATLNGKLAEIYFDNDDRKKESHIWGHSYVKKSNYKTKHELDMIEKDMKSTKVIYRNKKYKIISGIKKPVKNL